MGSDHAPVADPEDSLEPPLRQNYNIFMENFQKIRKTRNIFKKDIRRLSNTDEKRNQIRWFRRNSHPPLCMLESKTSEVVVLFRLVLCTSNSFR